MLGNLSKVQTSASSATFTQTMAENKSLTYTTSSSPLEITSEEIQLTPSPNEIIVKINYAALNPVDLLTKNICFTSGTKGFGRDYSGEVVAAGSNVVEFAVGDKVCGLHEYFYGKGTIATYLTVDTAAQKAVVKVPEGVEMDAAGCWALVYGTAYQGLHNYTTLDKNSTVLVVGASTAVGNAIVQIAKNKIGVKKVVGICSGSSFEHNKKVGYDELIDYGKGDILGQVQELVKRDGEKFNLIYDCVGNSYFFSDMNSVLKPKGESAYVTICGDSKMSYANPSFLSFLPSPRNLWRRTPFSSYKYGLIYLSADKKWAQEGIDMIKNKTYVPEIDSVVEFDEFQKAVDRLQSNKAKGKCVIHV